MASPIIRHASLHLIQLAHLPRHRRSWRQLHALIKPSHLRRHLIQNFSSQPSRVSLILIEGHKLHDIPFDFFSLAIFQFFTISIQLFHIFEILITDTNNDDTDRQRTELDKQFDSLWHIMNVTISLNQQNRIIVRVPGKILLGKVEGFLQQPGELSWAEK